MGTMRSSVITVSAAAVILGAITASVLLHRPPKAAGADAPADRVSASRAMVHVRALAAAARPTGSPGHARGYSYIVSEITKMGIVPETNELFHVEEGKAYFLRNIVAVVKGTNAAAGSVCLAAHYDSVPFGPGAADDAYGCAVLIETMRAFRGTKHARDHVFVFTDGEEGYSSGSGTKGAMLFADSHPLMTNIAYVLNFDCRGSRGPVYMYETGPTNAAVIPIIASAGVRTFTSSLMASIYGSMPLGSDFTRFARRGISGWNFAFTDKLQHYHTGRDTPENLSADSLQHALSYASALLTRLERPVPKTGAELQYFDVAGLGVVHYPSWLSAVLTLGAAAALIILMIRSRSRIALREIAVSFARLIAILLAVTAGVLGVTVLLYQVRGFYLVYASMPIAFGLYTAACGVYLRFFRNDSAAAYSFAVAWGILSLIFLFFMSGGNYLFVWPFILAVMLAARGSGVHPLTRAIIAGIVIILWGGTILALHETITAIFAFITVGVVCLIAGFFMPLIERIKNRAAYVTIAIGLAAVIIGTAVFRHSPAEPRFTSLCYALDRDTGKAFWYSAQERDAWTSQVLPKDSTRSRVDAFIPNDSGTYLSAAALSAPLPAFALEGTRSGDTVRIVIRYRDAYDYLILTDDGGNIIDAALNGKRLTIGKRLYLRITGKPEHDPVLTIRSSGAVRIRAIAHRYTLPESAGLTPMPADMMTLCNTPDFNKRPLKSGETMVKKTFVFGER